MVWKGERANYESSTTAPSKDSKAADQGHEKPTQKLRTRIIKALSIFLVLWVIQIILVHSLILFLVDDGVIERNMSFDEIGQITGAPRGLFCLYWVFVITAIYWVKKRRVLQKRYIKFLKTLGVFVFANLLISLPFGYFLIFCWVIASLILKGEQHTIAALKAP